MWSTYSLQSGSKTHAFFPHYDFREPNHKQFLNSVTYWDQSAKIQGVKNSSQDACDAPFPSAFSLWNRNHSRHILSASYWWSTAKLFWLLIYTGQPTGSCCLLKSEYLRQFITVALSKITKTVYTIKKKQQVTAARESQLLKKCISKNAHSRIMMKTGHEKKKKTQYRYFLFSSSSCAYYLSKIWLICLAQSAS